ncbi:MAG TPA: SPASM domain-containing protein, partial [Candidatus Eisenbacteria bacterium]|nr:SPASM domain-containing protein [Candidatus Eisenbacteria bacterium]
PVGCGVDIAAEQMVPPEEYERMLNWFYDRSLEGGIELKATCAPHYFRVVRQRRVADRRAAEADKNARPTSGQVSPAYPGAIGPTDMLMPGGTGISLRPQSPPLGHGHPPQQAESGPAGRPGHPPQQAKTGLAGGPGHPGGHPHDMSAMTKGCLAGTGVCFISHEGEVFPCGYLPATAGDLRTQQFADIWANAKVFIELRDTDNLKGKCGCCEFRNICMGCRARAFAATGDYLDEEPFCAYEPKSPHLRARVTERAQ